MGDARRIAVVDDDTEYMDLVQQILALRGWTVIPIRNAENAGETIRASRPDFVILDLRFHERATGWDVLDDLEQDGSTRHIPILVCSALADEVRKRADWLAERSIQILPKPFDIDDLYAAIETALPAVQHQVG